MEELVLIKLGGSLITNKNKPFSARVKIIKRLAREIKEVHKSIDTKIILGHGSGSFGHTVAAKYQTQNGIVGKRSLEGLTLVADIAAKLNRIVTKIFLEVGVPVFSLAPSSFVVSKEQKSHKVFLESLMQALKVGIMPLVYGDVVLDNRRGCCIFSTEKVFEVIAENIRGFRISKIIHCGNTDGVFDKNGEIIPVITPGSFKDFKDAIKPSVSTDVTGGMLHKVGESLELSSRFGVTGIIVNGDVPSRLKDCLLGKEVTRTVIRTDFGLRQTLEGNGGE